MIILIHQELLLEKILIRAKLFADLLKEGAMEK